MPFSPRQDYLITQDIIKLKDFCDFREAYITRPPYQRKAVWSEKKKQALMDSLLRRYYVPKLVFREVRLSKDRVVHEVIDGQQRINAVQEFFDNKYKLPDTLKDLSPGLSGNFYKDLAVELKQYAATLNLAVDRIVNIEDPKDPTHQKVATEIFARLQEGEPLNKMEVAHARLSSLFRNFIVKYADDITFDYEKYTPVDLNAAKHPFFKIFARSNERMEHLSLLARMLLVEMNDGPTDVRDDRIVTLIDETQKPDGIGDDSYEEEAPAKAVLSTLNLYHDLFKGDPMLKGGGTIKELSREYFVLSFFVLLRHIRKFYVINDEVKKLLREFFDAFYARWRAVTLDDRDMTIFAESRQQSEDDLRQRDMVMRQLLFEFLRERKFGLIAKDLKRAFSEAERIAIYRAANGICSACKAEGKPDDEATVPWKEYDADHVVPHAKGGTTTLDNAQLLCSFHNKKKSANMPDAVSA